MAGVADSGTMIPSAWRTPLACLGLACAAISFLFRHDAADMAAIWWNDSSFGHCLLVLPIVAWLIWQRRDLLAHRIPRPWAGGLLIAAAGGFCWLLGEAASVAFARHLGLVLMLQGAAIAMLGREIAGLLAFPLAYALFLVPFGDFLVQPLQTITAEMCIGLLHLFGVPATMDGVLIRIPGGYYEVAEACAGANFVLAMLAYAVLAAHICFTGWRRRAAFVAFALAMPVVANGIRAFATIYVGWLFDVNAAIGFDHIVYGWLFFAFIVAFVMTIAWRFFDAAPIQRGADGPPSSVSGREPRPVGTLALLLTIVLVPIGWSTVNAMRPASVTHIDLPDLPGWQTAAQVGSHWSPHYAGADSAVMATYRDRSGKRVELAIAAYARQEEGRELVGFGQGAIGPNSAWIWTSAAPPVAGARTERITGSDGVVREVVTFYRLGGVTTGSETRVKLETMKIRLIGGDPLAVAVTVSATDRAALERFVRDLGPVEDLI